MSSVDGLVRSFNGLLVKLATPVVQTNPEVAPMPRLPQNRSALNKDGNISKIPIRKIRLSRIAWNRDPASHPEFNRSVLEKRRGRRPGLTEGLTLPDIPDTLDNGSAEQESAEDQE